MQFDVGQSGGYDRAKTIFSPDGRLYQVEYAREAVSIGATTVGLIYKNGVVLGARRTVEKLQKVNPEKLSKIETHVGIATAGLISDGRVIVDSARVQGQRNMLMYDEPVSVYKIAKHIADLKQAYTQYGGVRPYGVAMLVGGVNDTPHLYQTDPAGIMKEWNATSIGRGQDKAKEIFESEFKDKMKQEDAIQLAVKALSQAEEQLKLEEIELAVISDQKPFTRISPEELEKMGVNV